MNTKNNSQTFFKFGSIGNIVYRRLAIIIVTPIVLVVSFVLLGFSFVIDFVNQVNFVLEAAKKIW